MRRRFMNISNSVPLSFEVLEDGLSISFSNEILYCINGGAWETLLAGEQTEEVNKGSIISFRHAKSIRVDGSMGQFSINKKCNVFGACSSIIPKVLGEKYMAPRLFYDLFNNCDTIVDASKLELPATTLAENCYDGMFNGCTSLTTAPELPATTLAENCYNSMFNGCTSLTTAPELPATTLASNCYISMFNGCTSLTTAPELPATTLAENCYISMFQGCTGLTSAPSILPATTLASNCYKYMFYNCKGLITAPELPATTLAENCYRYMFYNCKGLITAPELPATTLANECYESMFYNCSKLNYIKMLATDISASNCLTNWVRNVPSTGTFVKNPAMTTLPTGVNGIPSGWTVVNDGEESGGNLITFTINGTEYQAEEGMTFYDWALSDYYDSSCNLYVLAGGNGNLRNDIINGKVSRDDSFTIFYGDGGAPIIPYIYTDTIIQPIAYTPDFNDFG